MSIIMKTEFIFLGMYFIEQFEFKPSSLLQSENKIFFFFFKWV